MEQELLDQPNDRYVHLKRTWLHSRPNARDKLILLSDLFRAKYANDPSDISHPYEHSYEKMSIPHPLQHIYFFAFRFLEFSPIRRISTVPNNSNPPFDVIRPFRSFHLTISVFTFSRQFHRLFPSRPRYVFRFCGSVVSFSPILLEYRLLFSPFVGVPSPFPFCGSPVSFFPILLESRLLSVL